MLVTIEVPCKDKVHRIGIDKRRKFHALDHDTAMVEAFAAFGAAKPPCLQAIDDELEIARQRGASQNERAIFGQWLRQTTRLTRDEIFKLAFLTDPIRRGDIVKYGLARSLFPGVPVTPSGDLTVDQRIALMRTRGITEGTYGHVAKHDSELPPDVRMEFARKASDEDKGLIALDRSDLPQKWRLELAYAASTHQQCMLARGAGDWLPSKDRAELAEYCTDNVIIEEILKPGLVTPHHAYKLLRSLMGGPYAYYGSIEKASRALASKVIDLKPSDRIRLMMTLKGNHRPIAAKRLYRFRKHFGFTPHQIKVLEQEMAKVPEPQP